MRSSYPNKVPYSFSPQTYKFLFHSNILPQGIHNFLFIQESMRLPFLENQKSFFSVLQLFHFFATSMRFDSKWANQSQNQVIRQNLRYQKHQKADKYLKTLKRKPAIIRMCLTTSLNSFH